MKVNKIVSILILTLLTSSLIANATSFNINETRGSNPTADWTIMFYLDGDNNLESYAIDDFLEMAEVGSNDNVNIIVQLDRVHYPNPWYDDTRYGDWDTTKRYRVTYGMVPDAESAIMDIGEVNMGAYQTVIDFANWAKTNYPANKYCFIFWDHGTGWKAPSTGPRKWVCIDETSGDALFLYEIKYALDTVTNGGANKIGLIGFDACLMGLIEVGYELKDCGEYMTASENTEPATGWNYEGTLSSLVGNPSMTAEELGEQFVNYYSGSSITLSTVNLGNYGTLGSLVSTLALSIVNPDYKDEINHVLYYVQEYDDEDYVDLYHFALLIDQNIGIYHEDVHEKALAVMYEVDNVVTSEKHDENVPNSHGISIYAPYGLYDEYYDNLLFAKDTYWDYFLRWYHGYESNPPSKPWIDGPTNGITGTEYLFTFYSEDPDNDDIKYCVKWGDYSSEEWFGPKESGEVCEAAHTWLLDGAFAISIYAEDTNGARSTLGTFTIIMPRDRVIHRPLLNFLHKYIDMFPFLKYLLKL